LSKLFQYIPNLTEYTHYREPFLGGGSVALEIGKRYPHLDIWVNDLYDPLYNFWRVLQDQGDELSSLLKDLKNDHPDQTSAKTLFLDSKDQLNDASTSDLLRAVCFYIVNKCSFSGLTESSSFSKQASDSNFSMRGICKLPEYSGMISKWKITKLSYEELFCDSKSTFVYLDPPYEIGSNLYGKRGNMHKGFDHEKFASDCDRFISHQLVSYNSSQLIRDRFKQGWTAAEFAHTYTMRSVGSYNTDQASRKELVLTNYEM
jgi:DNA adenine methylase